MRLVVPRRARARVAIATVGAAALVGLVLSAVVLPGGHERKVDVGTGGGLRPHEGLAPVVLPDSSTSTTPSSGPATTQRRTPARATTSSAVPGPTAAAPAPDRSRGPGPATLLGRIVWMQEDSLVEHSMWSSRLDGSDERREVACPAPEVPPPAVRHEDYWIAIHPFDVSPDGTHVVRSCLVAAPEHTGSWSDTNGVHAVVVQDVDGVGYTELLRYTVRHHAPAPSWSPDGSRIAIWTEEELFVIRRDGSGRRRIVAPGPVYGERLTWSPDGTKLVTDTLEILDVATGTWSKPAESGAPWPWPGGWTAYGVVAWKPDGIWFVTEFTTATGPPNGPQTKGLYHLDPGTGVMTQAQGWEQAVYGGELVGTDVFGGSIAGDGTVVRVTPDGKVRAIPGINAVGFHIPAG